MLPPSFGDPGDRVVGSWLACSSMWASEERRMAQLMAWTTMKTPLEDQDAHSTLDVAALLAETLQDLRAAMERDAACRVVGVDARLPEHVCAVYLIAHEALARLANRYRRQELWMFWLLAERLATLPRIDIRLWVSPCPSSTRLSFGAEAALVNAAVAALVLSLRDLAAPIASSAESTLELERYLPTASSLCETSLPPSRRRDS